MVPKIAETVDHSAVEDSVAPSFKQLDYLSFLLISTALICWINSIKFLELKRLLVAVQQILVKYLINIKNYKVTLRKGQMVA